MPNTSVTFDISITVDFSYTETQEYMGDRNVIGGSMTQTSYEFDHINEIECDESGLVVKLSGKVPDWLIGKCLANIDEE
jgi:hypothetical protein